MRFLGPLVSLLAFITGDGRIAGPNVGAVGLVKRAKDINWTMNIRISTVCYGFRNDAAMKGIAEKNSGQFIKPDNK